jgi:DNA-binding NtrC family response regulator
VFLDEIGDLAAGTQVKLLRVIEDRQLLRVGGLSPQTVDVRFICATNRDLAAAVASGRFREDLFFRLEGIVLAVPPLRQRPSEIVPLAERFAGEAARKMNLPAAPALSRAAAKRLADHDWPGNVRELRNVIERAALLCPSGPLKPEHLQFATHPASAAAASGSLREQVQALERQRILDALEQCGGNQTRAARLLGMRRGTLIARLDEYQISRPRKRD